MFHVRVEIAEFPACNNKDCGSCGDGAMLTFRIYSALEMNLFKKYRAHEHCISSPESRKMFLLANFQMETHEL